MQRKQDDRPSIKEILDLDSVQDAARRSGIFLGQRDRTITMQQLTRYSEIKLNLNQVVLLVSGSTVRDAGF